MWTKDFWIAATERAIKTLAQAAAALLLSAGTGVIDTDWLPIVSISVMAAVVSVLTSIGSAAVTHGNASLTHSEVVVPHADPPDLDEPCQPNL